MRSAALEYASLGWPVFPVRHDKTPHTAHGVLDATTDPKKIEKWWHKWPGANVALAAGEAGLLVLDLDPGGDWDAVGAAVPDLPETALVASTPRGGEHRYYLLDRDDPPVPSRASPFAEHVDTRSFHGYVLLPPSSTKDGNYEWVERGRPALRSQGLLDACGRQDRKSRERDEWRIEPDLPENVSLARAWLRGEKQVGGSGCKLAIQDHGGDNTTYATAAMMKSLGLSEGTALEVMWEEWNERCDPPWDHDELERKITNGYAYNTSPPGNVTPAYHAATITGMFKPAVAAPMGDDGTEVTSGRFRFVDWPALRTIKPPDWLIPNALPEDSFILLSGPTRSFKTFVAIDAALTVATGGGALRAGDWQGLWDAPHHPGPVLYVAGEGRSGLRQRVEAWCIEHLGELPDRLDMVLADPLPHVSEGTIEAFVEGALKLHPRYRLVVLDTVARAMGGVNENSQEHATAFTRLADALRRELGATVLALHHSGHEHQERGRGSSAFLGDPDTLLVAARHDDHTARLIMTKQKDWPEWDKPLWAGLADVDLGDGRSSLASTRREPPKQEASRDGAITLALVDRHVMAALKENNMTEFSDRSLALVVATTEMETEGGDKIALGLGERTIRDKWLPLLREAGSGTRCQKYFDPFKSKDGSKGAWRWSPAAASDFSAD